MTWSYDPSLSTDKDRVRFLSGDTDTSDQMVSNEEITGVLSMYTDNIFRGAAAVCRHLASKFSRQADQEIDDMRKALSQRAKAFADRASELDAQASSGVTASSMPTWYAGGISVADKELQNEDTDRVRPLFSRDDMEFPGQRSEADR